MDGIEIVVATEEHREGIVRLLREEFVPREPFMKALSIGWDIVGASNLRLVDRCLKGPYTTVAVHPTDGVVGFCLNCVNVLQETLSWPSLEERLKIMPAEMKPLLILYEMVTGGFFPSLIEKGHDVVMQIMDLCVAEKHNGKGIAKRLVNASLKAAAEHQIRIVSCITSNRVSEIIFTKAEFKVWRSLELRYVFDHTGRPYVVPDDDTTSITCMLKNIDETDS